MMWMVLLQLQVLYRGLSLCGFKNINYLIPNRFVNGYGLSAAIVAQACELPTKPDMIITVDNGISSIEGVMQNHKV